MASGSEGYSRINASRAQRGTTAAGRRTLPSMNVGSRGSSPF